MEDGLLSALARLAEEDIRGGPSAEGIAPSAEGIADILWMARLLPPAPPQETPAPDGPPTGLPSPPAQAHTGPDRQPAAVLPAAEQSEPAPAGPPGDIDLHPIPARPTVPGAGRRPAVTIRVPAVPAIADPMDLAKALRPLKRWVARPRDVVLAEEATATTFGETELIMPVWALARERWLQVDLVVDTSASMAIWRQTATELRALLERQGAFRNVRAWAIDGDQSAPRLTPLGKTPAGQSVISHSAAELVDPGGRRAVLILTDAVGRSWHDGTMMPQLLTWAQSCPLAIVQVLPRRLWHRTALDIYPVAGVMRTGARPPFRVLDSGSLTAGNLPSGPPAAWVPVLYLDSAWLGPWAAMAAGTSEKPARMFAVPLYDEQATPARQPVPDQDFPADERLRIFQEDTASAEALELAGYLAAAPLSLPVMRLVQHAMLPRSGPDHLAEVFLSGLLVRANPADEGGDPDAVLYDFREGVREKLLGGLTRRDSLRVLDVLHGVSDTIAKRFGGTLDFRVLASRATAGHDALATESLPFARIAATVLEGLGGSYADLARTLSDGADGGSVVGQRANGASPEAAVYSAIRAVPYEFRSSIADDLTRIDLSNRELTAVPDWVRRFTGLTVLDLSGNRLTLLPEWIGELVALTSLDLSHNRLSTVPDSIGNLVALTSLDLTHNRLSTVPDAIRDLSRLTSLSLDDMGAEDVMVSYAPGVHVPSRLARFVGIGSGYLGRVLDGDGAPVGTCFQVAPGVLVTAWHVLDEIGAAENAQVQIDPSATGERFDAIVSRIDRLRDLAVLTSAASLPAVAGPLAATDQISLGEKVTVTGHVVPDDPDDTNRFLNAPGEWAGGTTRDNAVPLGRITSSSVTPGMSGAPVIRDSDGAVAGVVSGRYNSTDGWIAGTVWVARTENLAMLLDGITEVALQRAQPAVVPLRERVVEIVAALGTGSAARYRYGSGFRLGGRLVLTAAHVVTGAAAAGITVRGPDKVPHPARVVDGLAGDPDTVDLALLELRDQTVGLPAPPVAAVDRDALVPVEGCWVVGYPLFQEVESAAGVVRETAQVWGMILPAENLVGGLLSLQVTSAPRALPPRQEALGQSRWSGMSGAAVLAGERLLGVVSEHAPRRGESTITVTPLASLGRLPAAPAAQWWAHLATDPRRLIMLPARRGRAEPAYRVTLRQLRARTGVLQGRDGELEAIRAFAAGRPSAVAPPGSQYAWLVGGPWAGKTALLAEAVHTLPPEVDCVAYFLTPPTGDADRERFLAAVVPQLAWLLGTDPPAMLDEHVFRQLWEQAAQRAAGEGRQLLLIVDGLDEDLRPGGHSVAGWLPGRLPGLPARVLVASRMYPGLPDDVDPAHPLAALASDKLYTLPDSPHATRLRELADQEITQLLRRAGDDLALDVLGLLTAARGGPLTAADLAALTGSRPWKVHGVLDGEAARILRQVGPADTPRYAFAHETLLVRCQQQGVGDPSHARRIDEWAATWRDRGWPAARDGQDGTPLYLLDRYPQTLYSDPPRLAALVGDAGWVTAAIRTLGVDAVLAELKTAAAAAPGEPQLAAMHAVVRGQAHHLRDREAVGDPGFVPRQLCLQAAELGQTSLAADFRTRQLASGDPGPVLQWTTRRTSPALVLELGRHEGAVEEVAALPDGRLATGGVDGRVLVWDPAEPGTGPAEVGRHEGGVTAVAVLPDGRLATGGVDGRVLVWDPTRPGAGPAEVGRHEGGVTAVAVLPDGRLATGGVDGRVLVWDPTRPGAGPAEVGRHEGGVTAVAVLPDGRLATGGVDGRVLVWDPTRPGAGPAEVGRHDRDVTAVAVLPDGRLATGGIDGRVLVWDPDEPGTSPAEVGRHDRDVTAVAVLPDGRLATGGIDGRVLVWDPDEPGTSPAEVGRHDRDVTAVAVLPDGRLATGGIDGRVLVWDPDEPGTSPAEVGRHDRDVTAVAVLPDGRLATGGIDGRVLVWDPDEPGTSPAEVGRHDRDVTAVAVLPDGRLATGGIDGRVLVWDPDEPGTSPAEVGRHDRDVTAVAVLPDGRLATADGVRDGQVQLWDPDEPATGPAELGRHEGGVTAVAVLPDGRAGHRRSRRPGAGMGSGGAGDRPGRGRPP